MKSMATAIAVAAVLVVAGAAGANMLLTGFVWGGATSDKWALDGNWSTNGYPGELTANNTDDATIDDATNRATVIVDATVTYDVNWVVVDADTANANMTLKIVSGGDLDVVDASTAAYVQLVGGTDSAFAAVDAKLWYAAGNFDVDDFNLDGGSITGTRGSNGLAIVDLDQDLTITDDISVSGDVDIQIASGVTLDVDAFTMESSSDLKVTGASSTSTFSIDSYTNASSQRIELVGPLVMTF